MVIRESGSLKVFVFIVYSAGVACIAVSPFVLNPAIAVMANVKVNSVISHGTRSVRLEKAISDYSYENPDFLADLNITAGHVRSEQITELASLPTAVAFQAKQRKTIIYEFLDYRCPYCQKFNSESELMAAGTDDVELRIAQYPILSPESLEASKIVEALKLHPAAQKRVHDRLITEHAKLTRDTIDGILRDIGEDPVEVDRVADTPEVLDEIRHSLALGHAMGVTGTPSFVIGDRIYAGFRSKEDLLLLIQEANRSKGY
jgi:protein-disulfide isomerase